MNLQESIRKDLDRLNEEPLELTSDPMYDYLEVEKRIKEATGIIVDGLEYWKMYIYAVKPDDVRTVIDDFELDDRNGLNTNEPFVWVTKGIDDRNTITEDKIILLKDIIKSEAGPKKYILVNLNGV